MKKLKRMNWYIIVSVILIIAILIFGLYLINKSYEKEIPFTIPSHYRVNDTYSNLNVLQISDIYCENNQGYKSFVYSSFLNCKFSINYGKSDYKLRKVDLWVENYENGIKPPDYHLPLMERSHEGNTYYYELTAVPIKYEGFTDFSFHMYFGDKSDRGTEFLGYQALSSYNGISSREYYNRNYQKTGLIITVISLSIFSVLAAMKNLKDLIKK